MPIPTTIPNNVLFLKLEGVIDGLDVRTMRTLIYDKLQADEQIGVVVDLSDFEDASNEAIVEDLKLETELLNRLNQIPRIAMISDKNWVRFFSEMAGTIFPGIDVASFDASETEQATAFASDLPVSQEKRASSVHQIETDDPALIAFELNGRMTKEDASQLSMVFEKAMAEHDVIDVLLRIKEYDGFDWNVLTQQSLISMKLSAAEHVRRYAIVGPTNWMQSAVAVADPLFSIEMKTFDADEEDAAWAWLKQ